MSREDDMHRDELGELGHDERAALDALARLKRTSAPADVRERARASFVAGAGEASPRPMPRMGRPGGARRAIASLLPIAAVLVAMIVYGSMPREDWLIVDTLMGNEVTVAGVEPVVGATVRSGEVRTTPCSEVEFVLEDRLRVRFLSEATGMLPSAPGRWLSKERTLRLEAGEVFGSTGGSPLDFRLYLETPEARAAIVGTTFAMFRTEEATCYCLYDGSIEFRPTGASESMTLPMGQRVLIYKDGRPPQFEPLPPRETMKLQMMHDAAVGKTGGE